MTGPVPILYVGGTGRTGSTVLDRMLGNVPGVVAAGEVTWLWFALRAGGRCACGERHAQCPVWGPALEATFPETGGRPDALAEVADEMFALRRRYDSRASSSRTAASSAARRAAASGVSAPRTST